MIKRSIKKLKEIEHQRPTGYIKDILSYAKVEGDFYEISQENWDMLRKKYSNISIVAKDKPTTIVVAIPYAEWPKRVKLLKNLSKKEDVGAGDTFQRLASKLGGESYKKVYKYWFEKDCGCSDKQKRMNSLYPYKN